MILDFGEIQKKDVLIAGGKGANLGEMIRAGINVPKGFVLSAQMYRDFLKENKLEEVFQTKWEEVNRNETLLLSFADELRERIKKGKFSKEVEKQIRERYASLGENVRVAVRSSSTAEDLEDASFAGQQETYLNVQGADDVLRQIVCCYASLWGNRAVSYRFHQGYSQDTVDIAVVVQEMVESEIAGVLFTVNPVTKNKNEMFDTNGEVLKGVSGSSGVVTGKVCVIHSPKEFYKMKKGDILVCHLTDPEWTPLFQLASGVVADTGAALSHAAIVAREYRIPAVLGVGFATTKWKDGDMIQVDGNKGEVKGC